MTDPTIALFAKYPVPGLAKTRLAPMLGEEGAAALHRRLVKRTMATMRQSGLPFSVYFTGASRQDFADWLGDDVPLVEQREGDLGERLARVASPAILLGADIPGLAARHLRDAAAALEKHDVVIGPASDGGYYLIGFGKEYPFLWRGLEWGTESVLADTERFLQAHSVSYSLLDELDDCDRPEDLAKWPDLLA
ncbi:TIGR04282 family arsenosugar biosynthesis glycosyltransferase [Aurantiacibacter gangjinensis]|uniref:Uncharacterized protein n=1 Tax=Aurantiacibacter gangjinensis TaxID=502682 RepID=A0A0G9MK72_9SPHN|nr:TIGR04282 family arsenosugar biosynthesis glycosyltransferase [Aurantiacibacter gangjinensis]APE29316.1 hypothetical protein BMF35_b0061 [Aurantiacibacter gangjinensis]KLE31095.1 hypothetical protein AAW01_12720 [Aurantiacibacter gangjinensis]